MDYKTIFILIFLLLFPLIFLIAIIDKLVPLIRKSEVKKQWILPFFVFYFVFVIVVARLLNIIDALDKWTFFLILVLVGIAVLPFIKKIKIKNGDYGFEVVTDFPSKSENKKEKSESLSKNEYSPKQKGLEQRALEKYLKTKGINKSDFSSEVRIKTNLGLGIRFDGYYQKGNYFHFVEFMLYDKAIISSGKIERLLLELAPFYNNKKKKVDLTFVLINLPLEEEASILNKLYERYFTELRNGILHIDTLNVSD